MARNPLFQASGPATGSFNNLYSKRHISKMKTIRVVICSFTLSALTFCTSGCMALIHDAVVSSFPSYQETEKSWPEIRPGEGRVVVYFPRLPAAGFNVVSPVGGFGSVVLKVDGDKNKVIAIMDQTFVFIDLPSGTHNFDIGTKMRPLSTSVDVRAGEIHYVKIESNQFRGRPPRVVSETESRQEIIKTSHTIKQAVPFDRR